MSEPRSRPRDSQIGSTVNGWNPVPKMYSPSRVSNLKLSTPGPPVKVISLGPVGVSVAAPAGDASARAASAAMGSGFIGGTYFHQHAKARGAAPRRLWPLSQFCCEDLGTELSRP